MNMYPNQTPQQLKSGFLSSFNNIFNAEMAGFDIRQLLSPFLLGFEKTPL